MEENQPIQILVRPVQVLKVEQKDVSIKFNTTDELIDFYKELVEKYPIISIWQYLPQL